MAEQLACRSDNTQLGRAGAGREITKSLQQLAWILCSFFLFGCSSTPDHQLLTDGSHRAEIGGQARTVRILTSAEDLVARREIEFEMSVDGPRNSLPSKLRLSADMTHMDHGPALCELTRVTDHYRGSIVFVMGGSWELSLFDGEALVLQGRIEVREN